MEAHEVLGVSKDASEHEIRLAYKALAMKWHPDRQPHDTAGATVKFVEINRAYRTMLRNSRRAQRTAKAKKVPSNAGPSTTDASVPSSPESTSSSLPESSSNSTRSSSSRCSSPSQSSGSSRPSSVSSFTSTDTTPTRSSSSEDQCKTQGRSTSRSRGSNPSLPSAADSTTTTLSDSLSTSPSQKSSGRKLRKPARSNNHNVEADANECTPNSSRRGPHIDSDPGRVVETLHPSRAILRGAGADAPKKWVHFLNMTLEEIIQGKTFHFRVVRYTRSGKKRALPLEVHVPSGSRGGTEIVLEGVGNERKDGSWQDISFTVKEMKHDRFTRIHDDLFMDVRLPWADSLNDREGRVYLQGVDQKEYLFTVNYQTNRLLSGTAVIPGAGMPYMDSEGRGRIIVRWEISSPLSSWDAIKSVLRFKN